MIKILLTVAVLGSVGGFAGLATAQGQQGEAFGGDVSSLLAKLEAQCTHRRRTMPPDPRDGCHGKLRSDAQVGSGQGGPLASEVSRTGPGNGSGPGSGTGPGNGIGPGNGGGQAKGRR
jgi:hypothetical protein